MRRNNGPSKWTLAKCRFMALQKWFSCWFGAFVTIWLVLLLWSSVCGVSAIFFSFFDYHVVACLLPLLFSLSLSLCTNQYCVCMQREKKKKQKKKLNKFPFFGIFHNRTRWQRRRWETNLCREINWNEHTSAPLIRLFKMQFKSQNKTRILFSVFFSLARFSHRDTGTHSNVHTGTPSARANRRGRKMMCVRSAK